ALSKGGGWSRAGWRHGAASALSGLLLHPTPPSRTGGGGASHVAQRPGDSPETSVQRLPGRRERELVLGGLARGRPGRGAGRRGARGLESAAARLPLPIAVAGARASCGLLDEQRTHRRRPAPMGAAARSGAVFAS